MDDTRWPVARSVSVVAPDGVVLTVFDTGSSGSGLAAFVVNAYGMPFGLLEPLVVRQHPRGPPPELARPRGARWPLGHRGRP
jgi:hypothetical protein